MKAPNHIVGGLVFTGVFASLWNVNVFSTIDLFIFTSVATLLPDIDHPKSILGKMFYPIARAIDRHFGHRTITHSILFLLIISILSMSIEKHFSEDYTYSIALFFAVFSHLILDMITIQGVPLFYPFARNPCVIPGNPNFRIRSSNVKAELTAFALFFLIGISCINLFKHGFWTSYNRMFGTVKHIYREYVESEDLLLVHYDYTQNAKQYTGAGYLLASSQNEAVLFDKKVIRLDTKNTSMLIHSVKPEHLNIPRRIREESFFAISKDSLIQLCQGKIISGQIQASEPVEIIENNIRKRSNLFKFEHLHNFTIFFIEDTTRLTLTDQLQKKKLQLIKAQDNYQLKISSLIEIKNKYASKTKLIGVETDSYQKNKAQTELIELRQKIQTQENHMDAFRPDPVLLFEIESLTKQLERVKNIYFSGVINYPVLN